jgi:hypothetical protein
MVPAEQYPFLRKPQSSRPCVEGIGKITGRLSGIAAFLIDLAGSGFDMRDGVVFQGLLQGRFQSPGISGAHGIRPNRFGHRRFRFTSPSRWVVGSRYAGGFGVGWALIIQQLYYEYLRYISIWKIQNSWAKQRFLCNRNYGVWFWRKVLGGSTLLNWPIPST